MTQIDVDETGTWLTWTYHVGLCEISVAIPLTGEDRRPRLAVEGIDALLHDEPTQARAEACYGAMTKAWLLEMYRSAILADQPAGLAQVRDAATRAGLLGTRAPHGVRG